MCVSLSHGEDVVRGQGSSFRGAVLANTVLSGSDFTGADLTDADFTDAYMGDFDNRWAGCGNESEA